MVFISKFITQRRVAQPIALVHRTATSHSSQARVALLVGVALAAAPCGCGLLGLFREECSVPAVSLPPADASPIRAALHYLQQTQLTTDRLVTKQAAYAGDWPQCLALERAGPFVRDTNPFMATFIHHALALIGEHHQPALGLTDGDIESARSMRMAAIELMLRFQADPQAADAGTFGFWPEQRPRWVPGDLFLSQLGSLLAEGPFFTGMRMPVNVSCYPRDLAIATDADDTASIYAALLDHAALDGGPAVTENIEYFFADWRDLGQVPQRHAAAWLSPDSGAYLTWLAYRDDPAQPSPNDVDIIVNANVLYALGRYGKLDTPGVADAVAVINAAITSDAHQAQPGQISLYYPDNLALHYCITRAYREGGVLELAPAVELLVEDLLATAQQTDTGHCFWNRGDPHLNTAFGLLALLASGCTGEVTDGAAAYLRAEHDPETGAWDAGVFFSGRFDSGVKAYWTSPALTTAMALEALCQHQLAALADD